MSGNSCAAIFPSGSSRKSATSSAVSKWSISTIASATADVALDGISFTVNRGELVCVMGASGSGKSTLLRVLGGQLQPTRGQILLNGQPLYDNLDDAQALRQLHPAGRRFRRSPDDRGKPPVRRGDPLAAPLAARSHAAHRRQTDRARPERAARQRRRQPGEKDAQRRRT